MKYTIFIFGIFLFVLVSCKKTKESDNTTHVELLVKSKYVASYNPSDTAIISFKRDANKRWVNTSKKSSSRSWYLCDITAYRQHDGKIDSLKKIEEVFQGVKDTFIHKLYYVNNSNNLEYSLTDVKYGNGLIRVDSIRFNYYSTGELESWDFYFTDYVGTHFLKTERFEYDSQGNITRKQIELNPFFFAQLSYDFEYDYTRKAPITLEKDLALFLELPQIFFSVNQLKKSIYNDGFNGPEIYQVNAGNSVYNSFLRPTQLSFQQSGTGLNYSDQHFFSYE